MHSLPDRSSIHVSSKEARVSNHVGEHACLWSFCDSCDRAAESTAGPFNVAVFEMIDDVTIVVQDINVGSASQLISRPTSAASPFRSPCCRSRLRPASSPVRTTSAMPASRLASSSSAAVARKRTPIGSRFLARLHWPMAESRLAQWRTLILATRWRKHAQNTHVLTVRWGVLDVLHART